MLEHIALFMNIRVQVLQLLEGECSLLYISQYLFKTSVVSSLLLLCTVPL